MSTITKLQTATVPKTGSRPVNDNSRYIVISAKNLFQNNPEAQVLL